MTTQELISQAIQAGMVRRFDMGDRSDFDTVQAYLLNHGYNVRAAGGKLLLSQTGQIGRASYTTWPKVLDLFDTLRQQEGKQPLRVRRAS